MFLVYKRMNRPWDRGHPSVPVGLWRDSERGAGVAPAGWCPAEDLETGLFLHTSED